MLGRRFTNSFLPQNNVQKTRSENEKKGEKRCEAEIGRDQYKDEMNIDNQRASLGMFGYSFGGILNSVKKKQQKK